MGFTEQHESTGTSIVVIEPASSADIQAIHELLGAHQLPLDDFDTHIPTTLVARERRGDDAPQLVGNATLEMYGLYALLRSVAVAERLRGQGLGQKLTQAALDLAQEKGIVSIYLLTETAGGFFPRFGFRPTTRDSVPSGVLRSVEFTTACPTSALVMRLDLNSSSANTAQITKPVAKKQSAFHL